MNHATKQLLVEIAIKGAARHATQGIGGAVVATGAAAGDIKMIAAGVLLNAAAFGWSAARKIAQSVKAKRERAGAKEIR